MRNPDTPPRTPTHTTPLGIFVSPICAPQLNLFVAATSPSFTDYYAILGLSRWATSEEIKAAHRALRADYFRTDANKYAALQAAYAVLVNWEARREYDAVYRLRLGLPAAPTASEAQRESVPTGRKLAICTRVGDAGKGAGPVSPALSSPFDEVVDGDGMLGVIMEEACEEDGEGGVEWTCEEGEASDQEGMLDPEEVLDPEEMTHQDVVLDQKPVSDLKGASKQDEPRNQEADRDHDPSWRLKHHTRIYQPVLGTQPFESWIPILDAYTGRKVHLALKCRRPTYVGSFAKFARPA